MLRFSVILAAVSLCSLPALAQRLPNPDPHPSSAAQVLSEPIADPIRNTPSGREPLKVDGTPSLVEPAGVSQLDQCQTRLYQAANTVDSWADGQRKTQALEEIKGARVALLASDPRTCNAHVDKVISK